MQVGQLTLIAKIHTGSRRPAEPPQGLQSVDINGLNPTARACFSPDQSLRGTVGANESSGAAGGLTHKLPGSVPGEAIQAMRLGEFGPARCRPTTACLLRIIPTPSQPRDDQPWAHCEALSSAVGSALQAGLDARHLIEQSTQLVQLFACGRATGGDPIGLCVQCVDPQGLHHAVKVVEALFFI
jgi:hypothetical protein